VTCRSPQATATRSGTTSTQCSNRSAMLRAIGTKLEPVTVPHNPRPTGDVMTEQAPDQPQTASPDNGEPPHALTERRGHVLILTLNRPRARNALSGPMMAIMREAWDEVDSNPDIRVAILTGAGGAFCAGADLKAMTASHPGDSFSGTGIDLSRID